MDNNEKVVNNIIDTEMNIKQEDGSFVTVHPMTKEENIITPKGKKTLRESKFDDVETYVDSESELNVMNFYADGKLMKRVEFASGGGMKGGTITTTLPSKFSIRENESIVIPYVFDTPNRGEAKLFISIICGEKSKELEYNIKRIGAGSVNIGTVDKGINEISIYAVDFLGQMTNVVTVTVVCGSIEITSTFDDNQDFNSYAAVAIEFNLSSLDRNAKMVLKANIDGYEYTTDASEGYNKFIFPSERKTTGVHPVTLQVFSDDFQSNILEYNVVIVDNGHILISSKQSTLTIEEGNDVIIDYRISTIGQNMFNVDYLIDGKPYKSQNGVLGMNRFTASYQLFPKGNYVVTIKASSIDGTITGELNCNIKVTTSSFKRIEFVKPGLQVWFDMSRKTNNDRDRDVLESQVLTDNGRRARLRLHDYNYSTNGWIDGRLVNNGISWAEIENFIPLEDNVPNGFTFDIQFESYNAGDDNARVVDCTGDDTPYQGFFIDSEKAVATTESNKNKTFYTDQTSMRVTFVVDRTSTYVDDKGVRQNNPMLQTYINGMFTEVSMLSDSGTGASKVLENFMHSNNILINTDKSKTLFGNNKIKTILVYNRPLKHEEVLQNLMADIDNLVEQKKKYDKNYVTINEDLPTLYFKDTEIGKCEIMNKDTKQWIDVTYVSPDVEKYGPSFSFVSKTSWQGTSSLAYPIKNYKIRLYDYVRDEQGNIVEESRNNPDTYKKQKINIYEKRDNSNKGYAENTFCLKADYMDSSHCRNTGTARLVNDFLFDGHPNPAKQLDENTRDTINGFPIQLYVNGEWMGVYNFNLDKSCSKSLGMSTIEHTVRWEIKANSDTSEGAFKITWDKNNVEDVYAKILTDFEIAFDEDAFDEGTGEYDVTKYYDEIGIPHEGQVIGTYRDYAILSLARFVNFVAKADKETFIERGHEYFNIKQACRYYLNVMTMGMIDNFAKNCIINMYGDDVWWFSFYDMDSSMGLNNTGFNLFESDIEPSQPNIYNCSTSNMWTKLNNWMGDELFNEFKVIREGKYTYENLCKYLIEDQIDIIPEIAYNRDQFAKYISQGRQYLHMLHGNNKDHLKRWLYNRFQYVDSLFLQHNSPYTKQSITIRANKPLWVPESSPFIATFEIETYCPQYVSIAWRKNTYETKRVGFGEKVVFTREMVNSTDNEIIIYCAGNLKRIGDVSDLAPTNIDIGSAKRLIELKCENSHVLVQADLSKNAYLRTVSFKNCAKLGTASGGANVLDVSKCTNLRYIDVRGTQITSILSNVDGGNLEEINYSETTQSIVLSRQTNLRHIGIPYGYENVWCGLQDVVVEQGEYVTYDPAYGFSSSQFASGYTVMKNTGKDVVTEDNLWELNEDPIEVLLPVNGTTLNMYFFDKDKKYLKKEEIQDDTRHNSLEIRKIVPPEGTGYCMISALFSRPMTTDNNIDKFAIVKEGNREFRELKDLANVQISNCTNVKRLDLYAGFKRNDNIFIAMSNIQNLTIENSLQMDSINFRGFRKLRNLTIKNMFDLQNIGFDNMIGADSIATLYNVSITNCPLITKLTMNVNDPAYSVRFADGATLDASGLTSIDTIESNYSIKGLKKIILPTQVRHIIFDNNYGDGITDVKNIWSIDAVGDHLNDDYEGIDFKNMEVETIDMLGLTYIKNGLNFNISPTEQHPNMNTSRDGSTAKPWFRPEGSVDLTNYIENMEGMFRGVDTTKLNIIINKPKMSQLNLSKLFDNAIIDNVNTVNNVISKFSDATNMNNLMTNAAPINSIENLMLPNTKLSLREAFMGCKNITKDIIFSNKVVDVHSAFRDCIGITTVRSNWRTSYTSELDYLYCYMNCANIRTIDDAPGTLGEVPRLWGGYGFDQDVTMLAELDTEKAGTRSIVIADEESETVHLYTDWGDGTINDKFQHTYSRNGVYKIKTQKISKTGIPFAKSFKNGLIKVTQMPSQLTYYENLFQNCVNLVEARFDINDNVTSLNGLFDGCKLLESVRINLPRSCFKIDSVFKGCANVGNLDFLSSWNTSNVTTMSKTFMGCKSVGNFDVGEWNVSKVKDMSYLFQDCSGVTNIDVASWRVNNVSKMSYMFSGCTKLEYIEVGDWQTTSVTEMAGVFQSCEELISIPVSKWSVGKVRSLMNMFAGCRSVLTLDLNSWNTTNVTNLLGIFQNCAGLTNLQISRWNTNKVTTFAHMFSNISKLSTIDLSGWSFRAATTTTGMFAYCYGLRTIVLPDLSTNKINNTSSMFQGCSVLESLNLTNFNTSLVTNMSNMFYDCQQLTEIIGIEGWNTDRLLNMNGVFQNCSKLASLNLSNWEVSMVTDMSYLFYECSSLETLNITGWRTSNLLRMYTAFQGCRKLKALDVNGWDVSRVESLNSTFHGCEALTSLVLNKWDVTNVTEYSSIFQNCISLTNLDVTGWRTERMTSISYGFYGCKNLVNLDLATWNIENANNSDSLYFTFDNCNNLSNLIAPRNINASVKIPIQAGRTQLMGIINNLKDRSKMSSAKLTLGPENRSKLSDEDIEIASRKNWSVV